MRKLLSICLISTSLVLAQCSTTQIQQIETFLGQVQSATAAACRFIPTIDTIIAMVNSGIGQIVGVVTAAICNGVPPVASARYMALPRAGTGLPPARTGAVSNGVPINGWRV